MHHARNGVTAAVAFAAVSSPGKDGLGTSPPARICLKIVRCCASFAPIVAAMPLNLGFLNAVTAPR